MTRWSSILAASLLVVAPASAGILAGSTDVMLVGAGYIDEQDPSWENLADIATIADPPVGSFISVASGIPAVETFLSYLRFDGLSGNTAVFVFENTAQAAPFAAGSPYEAAFAGNRLTITSSFGFVITLQGTLLGTVATVIAVMAVASIGFMMLTGRMNWRFGATVIIGVFILFGATTIVAGIQSAAG